MVSLYAVSYTHLDVYKRQLYDLFEEAIDSRQDVSDVIHGVVFERI